ncbi:bifunctional protein PutA [Desulfosarcina widdelii]|uniref:L-glutamate gamma-semialdehyde dehydrogenase n=1 Tax=Desulfosarcina widdelii TaxID=947919 RepID=A0A5K7ZF14_9BACT|nr:proline dehydrogenase family protein [Desulfosarcina widdelii]BBO78739.1 bifunctional protein PutA [Desulfosarcina widdelii]
MGSNLEDKIRATGMKLYDVAEKSKPSLFRKDFWTGKVMDLSMKNEAFKQEMFRFVDVFPYLSKPESVARHIQEYFCRPDQDFPKTMRWGLSKVKPDSMAAKMAAKSIGKNIGAMGKQFITGETIDEAAKVMLKGRNKDSVAWTVKILKEAVTSTREEEEFLEKQIELMEQYSDIVKAWPALGTGEKGGLDWGFTPQVNISLMASCLYSQYLPKSCAMDYAIDRAKERLRPIYRKALELKAYVLLDMEHLPARKFTLELFKSINEEPEFRDWPHKGIAYQAYMKDAEQLLDDLLGWAKKMKQDFGMRLVKGAFWDEEVVLANLYNYPIPVFTNKHATDASYERCARRILERHRNVQLKCASHNIRTVAYVIECAKKLKVPEDRLEFQMLNGMAENLREAWKKHNLRLRLYSPVGEIVPGMAYLVRRLLENTSSESFLRQSFVSGAAREEMLKDPAVLARENPEPEEKEDISSEYGDKGPFSNEPPVAWDVHTHAMFAVALDDAKKSFPRQVRPVVDGIPVDGGKEMISADPNAPDRAVAAVACADVGTVENAIAAAKKAFAAWSATPTQERAEYLFYAAQQLRTNRHDVAALLVYESGKNWSEAQADICEAVDFLEFYGREMIRLSKPRIASELPGESSRLEYIPRGVGAVIAPWNFSLPISVGMVCAAIVTGNTVVYKPASQTPAIGQAVYDLFHSVNLPNGVLNFVPGPGSDIGDALVAHKDVGFTVFTGSKEVGLRIIETCGRTPQGARQVKQVIAEMGGKNAIIIDSDADVDAAVGPVVQSAFGYMGQKCSAASRLIVLEENYDKFVSRFKDAVETLIFGPADDPRTDLGAVIDPAARKKIEDYIQIGQADGTLLTRGAPNQGSGHFVAPGVFTDISPQSRLAQEEIFGPVVCIFKVKDFEEALEVANGVPFALTGGLFSRSPANIERACREFMVGSLYINRGTTGAMMKRHPFGGFKLSGVGSKAMGQDYLPQFMYCRTIVENTFRSGFAPMQHDSDAS